MKRIAVIGSGISGLSAAHYLSRAHEVHVFESDDRIGGHTHTVMAESASGPVPVDTGFIVFNDRTYPNFCRLMGELGVEAQPSDMSFAVTDGGTFEYSSRGVGGFFAQKRNYFSAPHYVLFREILRFNREAPKILTSPDADAMTLGEFLDAGRYEQVFIDRYLIPMTGAVWSMAPETMPDFPARTLIRFMQNHGMLGINTHPRWKAIRGGSHAYLGPLTRRFRKNIQKSAAIRSVVRTERGVILHFADRGPDQSTDQSFDEVVFACHGDQILPLLANPTEMEREVLACFTTTRNETCLHTDSAMLPRRSNARASWNYLLGERGKVTMTYHMNRLQSLKTAEDYCVTLNANGSVNPARALRRMVYEHPLYTRAAIRAQERWTEISGKNHTHFCGAWWFYGFHEDGVRSGIRVAESLGVSCDPHSPPLGRAL
jgi:uncharacterized protein